jgi:exonuclease SbcC
VNPTRLRARGYRSFDLLDLTLPEGCAAIVGANGAGKSSIVAGIDLALFGPESRSWSPYVAEGQDDLMLELTFEHGGETYRVRRGFSSSGRGKATLDLELSRPLGAHDEAEYWHSETQATIADTERHLGEILGMSRRTLRASSLLMQGDGAAFSEADPRERKQILAEILGLDRFEDWLAAVRVEKRKAEDELTAITALLAGAEAELAERPQVENALAFAIEAGLDAKKKLIDAEADHNNLLVAVQQIERQQSELQAARAERDAAEERLRSLERVEREAKEAAEALVDVRERLGTLPVPEVVAALEDEERSLVEADRAYQASVADYQAARREVEHKQAQRFAIEAQASDFRDRAAERSNRADALEAAGPGEARCDRCEQVLGHEPHAAAVASLRVEAGDLAAGASDLDAQAGLVEIPELPPAPPAVEPPAEALVRVSTRLIAAREGVLERTRLEERVEVLEQTTAKGGDTFVEQLKKAKLLHNYYLTIVGTMEEKFPSPSALAEAQVELEAAKTHVAEQRQRVAETEADKVRAEEAIKRLDALKAKVEVETSRREDVQAELDTLHVLEGAYGRNGMPTQRIERVLPQIETEADALLQKLGTPYRVELRTEREKKSGGTSETLDVVVLTEAGARPYETFSGGERTRINLALRISLARLLAHRRGAESRLLVIDEPEHLDAAGHAALAEVLRELESDFSTVLLVSHVPDLRDAFEQALVVSRNGAGTSEVAVA